MEHREEESMAKQSKIAKARKQREVIEKYAAVRKELKEAGDYLALAKLPKDSNPNRYKNRDLIDGRPRAYMRKFGMCRVCFREFSYKNEPING